MSHPKLPSAILASLQLNQMLIGEAFEQLAVWMEQKGEREMSQKLRVCVGDLRFNADTMNAAILEILKSEGEWH
ncbi:hypothetical protein ACXUPC_13960 [Pseudomonas marginalis]|uniref:hypothetical protein n=1 Tax=Pseudomonas marginalis TaxID=298 RepID=UPI0038B682E1